MNDAAMDHLPDEIAALPEILRAPVTRWFDSLSEAGVSGAILPGATLEARATLVRLVASSEFAGAVLARNWGWFTAAQSAGDFDSPLDSESLTEFVNAAGQAGEDVDAIKSRLRQYRNRCLVHILWRAIGNQDDIWDSLRALSEVADALIAASMRSADRLLSVRFGQPLDGGGERVAGVVLAMGKLGGSELNFSSDIDLIFLYSGDGETDGPRKLSAHEYFTRFSQQVVMLLDEVTQDGFVYRVDTRLRPFGESGPPVVSFAALENYLVQHGRSWERYAYIKARVISQTASEEMVGDLQKNTINPFVYRRYLDYGVFESLREMKALIEAEVSKREMLDNVKLGPGGIREIEFIAQSLQLVRGGADRELRCRELRKAMSRLGHARGLGQESVVNLMSAYEFLRKFENGIQAIRDQQTHDIPVAPVDRARLSIVMGYDDWNSLAVELARHREFVSSQFSTVAFRSDEKASSPESTDPLAALWTKSASQEEWTAALESAGYADAADLANTIVEFARSPAQRQIDVAAQKRLALFIPSLLLEARGRKRPGVVCARTLSVISQILRRSAYVALLNENPPVLERLVDLCDQSAYLAAEIARYPLLLDELFDPRLYTARISAVDMRRDLDDGLAQIDDADSETRIEALALFKRTTLFRITVTDIVGNLPIMKVSDALTDLAELVLGEVLNIAWEDLVAVHGEPRFDSGGGMKNAGFGIIAYGKLGGIELSYGSDLDLVFLHNSLASGQTAGGDKPLDNSIFFSRLVRRLVHFLTAQTGSGALYEVDTRLRPSGNSGLLVVSTDGFARYQEENAWTWEHQALLRSRPVAGSEEIAVEFERIRADTLVNRVRRDELLDDVLSMRKKMRDNLDKTSAELFDLKQGEGGIGDIEFLVQYLVLKNADQHPALFHFSDNIRQLDALRDAGYLGEDDVSGLQDAYKTYRLCTHRLTLDNKPPLVSSSDYLAEREFVTSVWRREMK